MTDDASYRLTRRAFLSIIAAAGATACTGGVRVDPELVRSEEAAEGGNGLSGGGPKRPRPKPPPGPYEPIAGDTYPNAKRIAGRFVEQLMTYEAGDGLRNVVRKAARKAHPDFDVAGVVERSKPIFLRGAQSRGHVVYPQLGGLTIGSGKDRACVMVIARQDVVDDNGDGFTATRTLDVRLAIRNDEWAVEDLSDAGGTPVDGPATDLPDLARRVLEDGRIELPGSARWDILRGGTDTRLLKTMLDLAAVAPYSVAVLRSGHPRNVFGTDLISGHTEGRAVDIWQLAGRPIVLQQPSKRSRAYAFAEAALKDFDVPELGSPWDLDGPPEPGKVKPSFTDAVHADHIHVAFKAA